MVIPDNFVRTDWKKEGLSRVELKLKGYVNVGYVLGVKLLISTLACLLLVSLNIGIVLDAIWYGRIEIPGVILFLIFIPAVYPLILLKAYFKSIQRYRYLIKNKRRFKVIECVASKQSMTYRLFGQYNRAKKLFWTNNGIRFESPFINHHLLGGLIGIEMPRKILVASAGDHRHDVFLGLN